ncbi:universal stress protein [Streptacidiphilus sp. EB129]|uniref:universal stress protein n=1 Tax=Streptacidiphilus sp. EB129 TaxID=3156262 RepID=UPI003515951B
MARRHVVAGLDGSAGSLAAVDWAARESLLRGVPLRVLHARPLLPMLLPSRPGPSAEARQDLLHRVESALVRGHPGLEVSSVEVVDTAPSALVAASEDAELLVQGARGCGGFDELLVGSVGLQTARRAHCPVVTVRPPACTSRSGAEQAVCGTPEIVLGVDARDPAEAALGFAFGTAERRGARLRVVHAVQPAPADLGAGWTKIDRERWQESEVVLLSDVLGVWCKQYPDVTVVREVVPGDPAGALVRAASGAELLVVGRRQAVGPYDAGLGPVSHAALHHAPTAVALVPHT